MNPNQICAFLVNMIIAATFILRPVDLLCRIQWLYRWNKTSTYPPCNVWHNGLISRKVESRIGGGGVKCLKHVVSYYNIIFVDISYSCRSKEVTLIHVLWRSSCRMAAGRQDCNASLVLCNLRGSGVQSTKKLPSNTLALFCKNIIKTVYFYVLLIKCHSERKKKGG